MSDSALLAALLAALAGLLAGRVWAAAAARTRARERPPSRVSPHYSQGLHYLAAGQHELAVSELGKVTRDDPEAMEVWLVLGNLLRETGQVERAIQVHQSVLGRKDLTRAERAYALACLGGDFRKAGFLDRATATYEEVLQVDPRSIHALVGLQKLQEEQGRFSEAYDSQTRLSRLRKTDDSLVLGHLQAELGRQAAAAGQPRAAESAFRTALSLDRRVFPARLGLADLLEATDPRRAAAVLEEAIQASPERAYLGFERLARLYTACGEPSRFVSLCERVIAQDPRDWRARVALARVLRAEGRGEEAYGLVLRALEANPQVLPVHVEMWRTLVTLGVEQDWVRRYLVTAEQSLFYRDPHVCTSCRYRADDMLWRCPHCHEWDTFVEERPTPRA